MEMIRCKRCGRDTFPPELLGIFGAPPGYCMRCGFGEDEPVNRSKDHQPTDSDE